MQQEIIAGILHTLPAKAISNSALMHSSDLPPGAEEYVNIMEDFWMNYK
jgi:hypothetical protein